MTNGAGNARHAPQPKEASTAQRGGAPRELPEAVKALIEARTGDAVYVVGPNYTIVHWDPNMESLSGVLAEEALGKTCCEAVLGEAEGGRPFCAHDCSVMHLAQEGRPVSSYEMRIRTRSGGRRWVSASNLTIETEEGPYLVHLLRDSQGTHDTLEMARGSYAFRARRTTPRQPGRTPPPSRRGNWRS
jgi:PAS domain S-box-containing protein